MNDKQKRRLALAGTVAFPPAGQGYAKLEASGGARDKVVSAKVETPRTSVKRIFAGVGVRAIYLPKDDTWLHGKSLVCWLGEKSNPAEGIVYVMEDTQTLLEVSTGMSAAEAIEYYPPVTTGVSVNHPTGVESPAGYVDGVGCPIGCTIGGDLPMGGG